MKRNKHVRIIVFNSFRSRRSLNHSVWLVLQVGVATSPPRGLQNGLVLELLPLPLRSPEILQAAMEQARWQGALSQFDRHMMGLFENGGYHGIPPNADFNRENE